MKKYYLVRYPDGKLYSSKQARDCFQLPDGNWVICTKYKLGAQAKIESDEVFKKCYVEYRSGSCWLGR